MCEDGAFQPISRCGTVNRAPSDGRRVQWPDQGRSGPPCRPVVSLRFLPFPVVSPRFSSFLGRSASDLRRTPALSRRSLAKQGPIQAETSHRQALRQERDDPLTTLKSFQDRFGPNRSLQGSRGTLALINSLTLWLSVRCFQAPGLRCSLRWSLQAVSPYFALPFSFPLCLCSCSNRPKLGCLQYQGPHLISLTS